MQDVLSLIKLIGLINLKLKIHQTFMNICTIFNTNQNHSFNFLFSLCFNFDSSLIPKRLFCMAFVYVYIVINFDDIYY